MSEYIVKLPTYGAADEFFKTHEMPDMTLYGYPLTGEIVRCRDCKHSHKDGALCNLFASWVPIAGGDEYECIPADVEPDGFCAWAERREQ